MLRGAALRENVKYASPLFNFEMTIPLLLVAVAVVALAVVGVALNKMTKRPMSQTLH